MFSAGYTVVAVPDGKKAYEKFCEEQFDLVITDIIMAVTFTVALLAIVFGTDVMSFPC